jgi:RNA polymerase sigma factor (sigma-70 family)
VRERLTITTGTDGQGEHSPSHGPDEGELLGRLRAGDEEAFACLVDRHHAAMVRFARGYMRSPAVAEEVAQDAWLGLLRGLDRFEGRSSLRTWLFRIVANRAISAGLQERQHLPVDDSELADDGGRFTQDGWWANPPVHWADEAVDRMPSTCGRSASRSRSPAASARMTWTRRLVRTSWTSTAAGSATGNLKEP